MNSKIKIIILKINKVFRIIVGSIFILIGFIGIITNISDITSIIIGLIFIMIGYFIYPDLKSKILSKIQSNQTKNEKKEYKEEKRNTNKEYEEHEEYKEETEYIGNGKILKTEYGETFNINMNLNQRWSIFWENILNSYIKINNKLEETKAFGDIEQIKNFEKDVYTFFEDRVLKEALKKEVINKIEPEDETICYYTENNNKFRKYEYGVDNLSQEEFNYAKDLYVKILERNKISNKIYIYQLYAKTLRRIGNFYKKHKKYELALNVFLKIRYIYQEGINDGKSIIKCTKEINSQKTKLLNNQNQSC